MVCAREACGAGPCSAPIQLTSTCTLATAHQSSSVAGRTVWPGGGPAGDLEGGVELTETSVLLGGGGRARRQAGSTERTGDRVVGYEAATATRRPGGGGRHGASMWAVRTEV